MIWTKFAAGAWMVTIAIPLLIVGFYAVHRHYRAVARRLRAKAKAVLARPAPSNTVVLYVEQLDDATREALWYARRISRTALHAVHVPLAGSDPGIKPRFFRWAQGDPHLDVLASFRDLGQPLLSYLGAITADRDSVALVVMPELVVRGVDRLLHNQRALYLKRLLLFEPQVILTSVPYQLS